MRLLALFALFSLGLPAYVRNQSTGGYYHRTDNTSIQFTLSNQAVPGLTNSSGATWISADSDVLDAVNGAMNSWSTIGTANIHFESPQVGPVIVAKDGTSSIVFTDNASDQALLNGALAITRIFVNSNTGAITDTDVIFSAAVEFSTTLTPGTYDLQSVLTHELGHSLGANHSGVLGATMFQASGMQDNAQATLQQDDIAFATENYPLTNTYGTIAGTLTDTNGNAVKGGLVTAADPVKGITVGSFSSLVDGTFSFFAPPGNYEVWAEPLGGEVKVGNLYLTSSQVNANFQPVIAGGFANPSLIPVTSQATSQVSLSAPTGTSPIVVSYAGIVSSNGPSTLYSGPLNIPSGEDVVIAFEIGGLDSSFDSSQIKLIGPLDLDTSELVEVEDGVLVFEVHAPPVTKPLLGSFFISYKGNSGAFSGGIVILKPPPSFPPNGVANVFRSDSTPVAPGEIVSFYGTGLGPSSGAATGGFDKSGSLPTALSGVQVLFDGHPAPLFYAGSGQINAEVPYEVSGQSSSSVTVAYNGSNSSPVSLQVTSQIPGLAPHALNQDYSVNTQTNAIADGQYLFLYATGLGVKNPALATGAQSGVNLAAGKVTASLNGNDIPVAYAGSAPGFTGLDQVNIQVPPNVHGQVSVAIAANGTQSNLIQVWVQ